MWIHLVVKIAFLLHDFYEVQLHLKDIDTANTFKYSFH